LTRIAYATTDNPLRPSALQNGHYLLAALQRVVGDVVPVGPLRRPKAGTLVFGARKAIVSAFWRQQQPVFCEPTVARHYGRQIQAATRRLEARCLFVNQPRLAAYLDGSVPVVVHTDSTVQALLRVGSYLDGWCQRSIQKWELLDRRAIQRAEMVFYTSEWAAESAVRDYGADPAKIQVVANGANIDDPEVPDGAVERVPGSVCHLLFYGGDWQRKGGDIAYGVLQDLNARGIAAKLTICGPKSIPEGLRDDPNVEYIPRINKDLPRDQERFAGLLRRIDYLILPTRADCTPSAIAEAAAWGVPAVVTDVGGVASMVRHGVDGFVLEPSDAPATYAALIADSFGDPVRFTRLRNAARQAYRGRLNWDTAVREMTEAMKGRGIL
jgi:glycosyltransferase involved in cell wall biosynthesis